MLKVLLFGNLASGKSHLAARLLERYPAYEQVSIDDHRRKYSDGSTTGERLAKQSFISSVMPGAKQVIEATGFGETAELLSEHLRAMNEPMLIILLTTPLDICMARLEQRVWDVPYPAPPEQARELAQRTDALISAGSIENLWDAMPQAELIKADLSCEADPQKLLVQIERYLKPWNTRTLSTNSVPCSLK